MMQHPPNPQTAIRLNVGQVPSAQALGGGYAQAPSTPRPTFASDTSRPTVYGPPPGTLFGNSGASSPGSNGTFVLQQARPEQQQQQQQFQPNLLQQQQQPQQQIPENNRQLRDLLQRQQMITPNMPAIIGNQSPQINPQNSTATTSPRWNQGDGVTSPIDDQSSQLAQQLQQQQPPDANTFRTPLPPGMVHRPQRGVPPPGKIIRQGQIIQHGPRTMIMSGDMRQRFIRPPGNLIVGQQLPLQQQQNIVHMQQQQQQQQQMSQQQFQTIPPNTTQRMQLNTNEIGPNINSVLSSDTPPTAAEQSAELATALQNQHSAAAAAGPDAATDSDTPEIPDNVTAELEKLEDENGVMGEVEGVGDLLGDLGEDDDDELFNSLTAEMGADFNILEYADPELDDLNDGEKANLLDSLDFGDAEPERGAVKKDPPDPMESTVNVTQHHQTPIESVPQKLDSVVTASMSNVGPDNGEQNQFSVTDNSRQLHQQQMQQHMGQPNAMAISGQQQPQQLSQQQIQIQQQQLNRMKALQQGPNAQAKLQHIQQQMLQQVSTQLMKLINTCFNKMLVSLSRFSTQRLLDNPCRLVLSCCRKMALSELLRQTTM